MLKDIMNKEFDLNGKGLLLGWDTGITKVKPTKHVAGNAPVTGAELLRRISEAEKIVKEYQEAITNTYDLLEEAANDK